MDMNMPVNVPVDDPNADTEWNDILRKHGVIPEKPPSPTPAMEEALVQARELAHAHRLAGQDLDALDALEDEEDEAFLAQYRQRRLHELATLQHASVYNHVHPLQKSEYAREVTEESRKAFVLVLLTSSTGANAESQLMVELWRQLARKFGDMRFCQMQADLCIDRYPDRNTPTVLVYRDGHIRHQLVTLKDLNGLHTSVPDFEKLLLALGALQPHDSRLQSEPEHLAPPRRAIYQSRKTRDDDESDWD